MSLYLKYFQGQFVEIIAEVNMIDDEDNKVPLLIQAFVVDRDGENTYLGTSPLEVNSSLLNDDIKFTTITDPSNFEDSIINGPETDSDLN